MAPNSGLVPIPVVINDFTLSNLIEAKFAALKEQGRAGLDTVVTAGDPDYETSLKIIQGLPKAGADVIEFGMP